MDKPNFVLVVTDQQRMDSLSCYGNKFVKTPNIDKLAKEGAKFNKAFTPWPVCTPARGTMWTGKYPHEHDIRYNVYDIDSALDSVSKVSTTVFDYLKEEDYTTAYFGKWHLGEENPGVFDVWDAFNSQGGHWVDGIKDGQYKPDVQTDKCINFIENMADKEKPFIMVQGYYPPHDPFTAPERFYEPYRGKGIPFPGYYAAVSDIDYNVGRIIDTLEKTNQMDSTIFIYLSDHGETFGGRKDSGHKYVCFEESIRIPFIVYCPGIIEAKELDPIIGLEDLMSTLLDYAGIDIPGDLAGKSIRPWLKGDIPANWRQFYYVQVITHFNHYKKRCLRNDKWKLILNDGGPHAVRKGPHSLYNLKEDPEEQLDVFDNSRDILKLNSRLKKVPNYDDKIYKLTIKLKNYAEDINDDLGVLLANDVLKNLNNKK